MNPSDANSSLATLRQLKEMLDAGALTPQEFEALKQKLIFGKEGASEAATPLAPDTTPAFVPPVAVSDALTSAPVLPGEESIPLPPPTERPAWLTAPLEAPASELVEPAYVAPMEDAEATADEPDNQRNPLNLIFAIGGALVFLAVVLYLTLGNRGTDEHLTSTTQTAADSARVAPEVGPQAQQLTLPPAAPETIRVAPAVPPAATAAASRFSTDSAAKVTPTATTPVTTAPAPTPAPAKPTAKPTPASAVATDTAI